MSQDEQQQQLIEYESQLNELNEMISLEKDNSELIQLKNDLLELIALTKSEIKPVADSAPTTQDSTSSVGSKEPVPIVAPPMSLEKNNEPNKETAAEVKPVAVTTTTAQPLPPPPSKFEIPPHLIPLESDNEPERNKKRRAIKALKRKWKSRVVEVERREKQKSWQDFVSGSGGSKKKSKKRGLAGVDKLNKKKSIFRTEDGMNAKVGVIGSGKSMTEYTKRAKH
mmetsp:Transcript_50972/g.75632  ORF Transcript_50972/g.75632 Transcript_50972/m.75632 type:complete len:225 (-) Transcript_50972:508-1182(-)|eukprot:CAMPEP_0195518800 /NCGR_PEP_ID=MMETSP0794_2-20130614/13689_1 /TAXON_ID=515487 /ORGANISM="Stephanopyxis turris, Strain CCMP 815" /LENGTH=224 /DNA_ID=CAMNT_0040647825 /DNA_START=126 /DNA_END=800 /DNA_ORIENTATION=-